MSKAQAPSLRTARLLEALALTSCLPPRSGCLDKVCSLVGTAAPSIQPKGHTASSTTVTGVKKRDGLTHWYPPGVATATTTIGMISNACDLLRAVPS
jgi:hypothetical protein